MGSLFNVKRGLELSILDMGRRWDLFGKTFKSRCEVIVICFYLC